MRVGFVVIGYILCVFFLICVVIVIGFCFYSCTSGVLSGIHCMINNVTSSNPGSYYYYPSPSTTRPDQHHGRPPGTQHHATARDQLHVPFLRRHVQGIPVGAHGGAVGQGAEEGRGVHECGRGPGVAAPRRDQVRACL